MINRIIFGCHNLTGGGSFWQAKRVVDAAMHHGIRRFDVAPSYGLGTAEATLARALGRRRVDVQITTKFGILPPRFGALAAWAREPYRLLRKLAWGDPAQPNSGVQRPRVGSGPTREYPFNAIQAATRSLRALAVDRLDGFLVHERLPESYGQRLTDDIAELKRRGLIVSAGVSGALDNVQTMAAAMDSLDIVQVAVSDAMAAPPTEELRIFHLLHAARQRLHQRIRDSDAPPMKEAAVAVELAKVAHDFLAQHQQGSVLFNATSPQRLELFVAALTMPSRG